MKNLIKIFPLWYASQKLLKTTLRWKSYVEYQRNGKSHKHNKIRRQNILDHTISKLFALVMILSSLKSIFKNNEIDFELLFACIVIHDFGEPLKKEQFDIQAGDKVDNDDVTEYLLLKKFLETTSLEQEELIFLEKVFLLQFALTSYGAFPKDQKTLMSKIRKNKVEYNTALLFQIIEKWEYHFYAYEHKNKHPSIWEDVCNRQAPILNEWINKYPNKYRNSLVNLFLIEK